MTRRLWILLTLVMPLGLVAPASAASASEPGPRVAPIPRSIWLYEPDPGALPAVNSLLDEVLDDVRPANRRQMSDTEIRIHVIPQDWNLTQLPPWESLRGLLLPAATSRGPYTETRTFDELRGLGPPECIDGPLDIAIAEEHLVSLPRGPHPSPSLGDLGKILVHEVGHGVECSLSAAQSDKLDAAYREAAARYPAGMVGERPDYSVSNRREYFAEGTTAWFESARDRSYRRPWLKENDPALYDLMASVYDTPPPPVMCGGERATHVLRPGDGPFAGTPGADVIVGTDGDDVISGGGGDDRICGGGGDDTLVGGYGDDRLYGGPGRDDISDSSGSDVLVGGAGDDTMDSRDGQGNGPDRIDGSEGNDTCTSDANDEVVGCIPPPPPTTTSTTLPPTTTTTATTLPPTTTSTTLPPRTSTTSTTLPPVTMPTMPSIPVITVPPPVKLPEPAKPTFPELPKPADLTPAGPMDPMGPLGPVTPSATTSTTSSTATSTTTSTASTTLAPTTTSTTARSTTTTSTTTTSTTSTASIPVADKATIPEIPEPTEITPAGPAGPIGPSGPTAT